MEYIDVVHLYNWGEPFLNPHILNYVRRLHDMGKFTEINSNFSAKDYDDHYMESLVGSGLDQLQISIDGASQESYGKYRVNGDFKRVLCNMKRLTAAKQRLNSATPELFYKMMLNRFNEEEVEEARRIAEGVGAVFSLHETFWIPEALKEEWRATAIEKRYGDTKPEWYGLPGSGLIHTCCRQMWEMVVVNANGDVFPCCAVFDPAHALGNLLEEPFSKIWNGAKMRYLRYYVTNRDAPAPGFDNHCVRCGERYCTQGLTCD